jgi:hypothetical protein
MSQTSIKRAPVEAFFDASTIQYCPEDPDSIVIQLWHDYRWSPGRQRLHRGLDPPVLAELDALKVGHSSPEVREKARKFSGRIKEWRRRGELHRGVKVQGWCGPRRVWPPHSCGVAACQPHETSRQEPNSLGGLEVGTLLARTSAVRLP